MDFVHNLKKMKIYFFLIHHTNDDEIIDDILLWTLCALDTVEPAKLDPDETSSLKGFVDMLPISILSGNSVEDERKKRDKILTRI